LTEACSGPSRSTPMLDTPHRLETPPARGDDAALARLTATGALA
jgi:hypothetical protein